MMKVALSILAVSALAAPALAAPAVDAPAPAFSAMTSSGKTISLEDFRGKTVILEWTNDGCPFVKKHYETGNMQETQRAAEEAGAVWISVISSAPGKQGHADAARANRLTTERNATPDYVILDESGALGKAYDAKTTPHMFIVDKDGVLRYDGAIDGRMIGASNYVLLAMNSIKQGKPVTMKRTKPYGCSVKYGS